MSRDTHIDFHMPVKIVMHDEVVGKANAVGLHGMADRIGIITYIVVIEVRDLSRRGRAEGHGAQGADDRHGERSGRYAGSGFRGGGRCAGVE